MQEWKDVGFDNSPIGPRLFTILAHINCKLQIGSNPAWFVQDDNPLLLDASELDIFNISTAQDIVNSHWESWSGIMLRDFPNGFESACDHPDSILKSSRLSFLFKVRIFTRQLKSCIEQAGLSAPQSTLDLLAVLRLWEQVTCTMVTAALAEYNDGGDHFKPLQMRYDSLLVYFRRINEMSGKILQAQILRNVSVPAFPIDYAIGTALFFCGFSCREWSTRRAALHILKAWERRFKAGTVTEFLPAKISALERIIDVESHGLQSGDVIPESARISFVRITASPGSPNVHFSYRLLGIDGVFDIL